MMKFRIILKPHRYFFLKFFSSLDSNGVVALFTNVVSIMMQERRMDRHPLFAR